MLKRKIYDVLYCSNSSCEEKLDDIENLLIQSLPAYGFEEEYTTSQNILFWSIISGLPFIIGLMIGLVL